MDTLGILLRLQLTVLRRELQLVSSCSWCVLPHSQLDCMSRGISFHSGENLISTGREYLHTWVWCFPLSTFFCNSSPSWVKLYSFLDQSPCEFRYTVLHILKRSVGEVEKWEIWQIFAWNLSFRRRLNPTKTNKNKDFKYVVYLRSSELNHYFSEI